MQGAPGLAGLVVVGLLLASGLAAAESAGTVEADAASFPGRARADAPGGALLVESAEAGPTFTLTFEAPAATILFTDSTYHCTGGAFGSFCSPQPDASDERTDLADVVITIEGPVLAEFQAWVAAVGEAPARVALETAGDDAGWKLAANRDGASWTSTSASPRHAFPPGADAAPFRLSGAGWEGDAEGALAMLVRGATVTVSGTTVDGERIDGKTYETSFTERAQPGGAYVVREERILQVTASEDASASFEFAGIGAFLGEPEVVAYDGASFAQATGGYTGGREPLTFTDRDVFIPGTLRVTPLESDGSRLTLRVESAGAVPPPPAPDEEREPLALAGAVGIGAGAAALAALAYYWPVVRFGATALLLPLYSRIERNDVLAHEKREEIYGLIRSAPGIHAHEISARANIGWGTTVYHLKLLETHSLVVSKRAGRYKRFFPSAGATGETKQAYGVLRNETTARVADLVRRAPGSSQKEVCETLGLSPSLVSWHVDRLEEAGLVKKIKEGRRVRYFAGPAWSAIDPTHVPAVPGLAVPVVAHVAGGVPAPGPLDAHERGET